MLNSAQNRNDHGADVAVRTVPGHQIDILLGRRLKLRRTLLGLTQDQIASACGISYQQVHKYETGQSRLSTARLLQFSLVLDTSVGWFFDGLEYDGALLEAPSDDPIDKAMTRLVSHAQQIKSRQRLRQLIDFAKLLAEADSRV